MDSELADLLHSEHERQGQSLHMLAPAMLTTEWLRQLMGTAASNLDGEGYVSLPDLPAARAAVLDGRYPDSRSQKFNPCGRYMEYAEARAQHQVADSFGGPDRTKEIYVNLHPVSGTAANLAALMGVAQPGDVVVALEPKSGGHISHGAEFHLTGRQYQFTHMSLGPGDNEFPVKRLGAVLEEQKPKAMLLGASSYPWSMPWSEIAKIKAQTSPETIFIADIAHFAGLVLTRHYANPVGVADIVTGVGYKSMGGPKSGFILTTRADMHTAVSRALFPGLQGAPRMADILAMGVAAALATQPKFRQGMSEALAVRAGIQENLAQRGVSPAFGGSDTHMLMLHAGRSADDISARLEDIGVIQNANMLPGDASGTRPSGIRLGTIGLVQQGLVRDDADDVAEILAGVIKGRLEPEKARIRVGELLQRGRRRLHD
ncbi:hypothetical protein ACFV2X_54045 [Streptomyces sp. NPDC059679]|uniref:hypothetical protein n=1 Tax=Streptomyces sp. NPDC059679 TaxID=3346903 RepID=UPI0036CBBB3C